MFDNPMYVKSNYIEKKGIVGCFAGDIHIIKLLSSSGILMGLEFPNNLINKQELSLCNRILWIFRFRPMRAIQAIAYFPLNLMKVMKE